MSYDFYIKKHNSIEFLVSPLLENSGLVRHFFSTRIGGASSGVYESLNLGIYTDDDNENVKKNMKDIFYAAEMSYNNSVYLKQIHSSDFFVVNSKNASVIRNSEGDAIITSERNVPVGVFTADCVPILLLDKSKCITASVHAGWKGTNKKIVLKVIEYLIKYFGTKPSDLIAALGPSIGPCCFKVGAETAEYFSLKGYRNGEFYVNLWAENINQIISCGVPKENVDSCNMCSKCISELFYSYRRDNGITGRMGSFIELI